MPRVTAIDVARRLGVSQPTVSAAFRPAGGTVRVSKELRDRITRTAMEMGYRPNVAARAQRTGRFGTIGLIASSHPGRGFLPQALLHGMSDELRRSNLRLLFGELPYQELTEPHQVPQLLREWSCDGFIINSIHDLPPALFEPLKQSRSPVVWLNRKQPENAVYPDEVQAGRLAAETLIQRGCRRLGLVNQHGRRHYSVADRIAGVSGCLSDGGFDAPAELDADVFRNPEAVPALTDWLTANRSLDGVVCYAEEELHAVLAAAGALGIKVGHDLHVAYFAGNPRLAAPHADPVAVLTPFEQVGRQAVSMLNQMIKRGGSRPAIAVESTLFADARNGSGRG